MLAILRPLCIVVLIASVAGSTPARAGDAYAVDTAHSSVSFMISHIGITDVHGRFNEFSGNFTIDKEDPAKSSFALSIKVASVDTNNKKRDDHLRSPDFFNVKEFPQITFESTGVKALDNGYQVTGDLNMHGVKKPITFALKGGKTAEFPKGFHRIGFTADLTLQRADFGMAGFKGALGDDVRVIIGLEAFKKK